MSTDEAVTAQSELTAANRDATRIRLNPKSTMAERSAATARVKAAHAARYSTFRA